MVEFRTLRREELNQWFDYCAQVFTQGSTPTDALYFMRHWYNDSRRRLSGIRWLWLTARLPVPSGPGMCICCRGRSSLMGGIGEVSTKPQFRRQGLSSKLLEMSIAYMER